MKTNSENSETHSAIYIAYLFVVDNFSTPQAHFFCLYFLKTPKGWRECCPAVYCDPNVYATDPIGRPHTARQHTEAGKGSSPMKTSCS